jgi:hypothetical protein
MKWTQGLIELLLFQGSELSWLSKTGTIDIWKAISGIPNDGNTQPNLQKEKNAGPIPEGWWYVDPSESKSITRPDNIIDFLKWIFKDKAYGGWYTPIHPFSETETYNRSGFQIHGGWEFGSIGCIDLSTNIRSFSNKFESYNKVMLLYVDYSKLRK